MTGIRNRVYFYTIAYIQEGIGMKGNANTYLILGVVFLAVGITMIMTGAVSRTIAYGDIVLAIAFFALSARAK